MTIRILDTLAFALFAWLLAEVAVMLIGWIF